MFVHVCEREDFRMEILLLNLFLELKANDVILFLGVGGCFCVGVLCEQVRAHAAGYCDVSLLGFE